MPAHYINRLCLVAFAFTGLALSGAVTQAVAEVTGISAGTDKRNSLDEIVVSTTRRGDRLRQVNTNISRIGAEDIAFQKADHISENLNRLAGVNIQRGNGQEHLTSIRSPVLTGGAGAGSFLYLEDGVPLRAAAFANVNGLFEAHSELAGGIEVVRGPGSAFHGSNAVHGLINVLTPEPVGEPEHRLEASLGSYGRTQINASTMGRKERLGAYAGLTLTSEDGYRQHSGLDQQKLTIRTDWRGNDQNVRFTIAGYNLNQETAGFVEGPDSYKDSQIARTNPNPEAYRDAKAIRTALHWDRQLGNNWTLNLTPYFRWNEMIFPMHFLPSKALEENGHKSVGALTSFEWRQNSHRLIVGSDLEWTDGYLKETQTIPDIFSYVQGVHYDFDVTSQTGAIYAHGEWQATERLRFIGGIRAEGTRYDYDNNIAADTFGRFIRPADRQDDFVTVTPKLGLIWQLNNDNLIFTNYARGGRAPQATDAYRLQLSQAVGEIEEEELDSFEIGARGERGGLRYEVAAYAMRKKNFFFRDADGFNVTDSKTRHWGIEASIERQLGNHFAAAVSAAYGRNEYDSTHLSSGVIDGNEIDTAPRLTGNARLVWSPVDSVRAELEWVHMDEYFTDPENRNKYPGHDLINLRARWILNESVSLSAAIRNVTNTDYAERADFAFDTERYFPGEDRTAEIVISLTF